MEQDEILIPEIEEKPHRNIKLPLGIAAVCVIVFAVAAAVIARVCFDEERALLRGLQNLAEETKERQELAGQDGTDAMKAVTKLNVSVENFPVTLGIDTVLLRDANARKMLASTEFSVMNNKLAELQVYGEDESLMLAAPTIWEKNFVLDTKQIDRQYNDSVLAKEWGRIELPEGMEISIDLFPTMENLSWEDVLAHCLEMIEELTIERLEKEITISVPEKEDIVYQCSQYRVVVPAEFMRVERIGVDYVDKDMALLIFVDEDDRIIRISLEEPFSVSDGKLTGDIYLIGEERSIDDMIVNMQLQVLADISEINDSLLLGLRDEDMHPTVETTISAEVVYREDDMNVIVNLNELTASVAPIGALNISGTLTLEPLREEISLPERETIRVAEITEAVYNELEGQLMKKLFWKIPLLSGLLN